MSRAFLPDPTLARAETLDEPSPPPLSYGALFLRFLKLGAMAFGGPVTQIAMLRRELVEEEGWMSGARFNRLLAVMQVLPGPEAHELSVHLGMRAKGRWGGVLAGLGFMLPGFVLMMILSWLYFRIDFDRAWVGAAFLGVQAAVIALILRAVHRIGQHILIDRWLWGLGIASAVAALVGVSFWITLPAAGFVYALVASGRRGWALGVAALAVAAAALFRLSAPESAAKVSLDFVVSSPGSVAPWILFLSGLKAGLLTFGGAYTAIPFLRNDAAAQGWMGDRQFLDGLALSGVLPAPLIIFSTFVGYVAGGPLGALAITAGVFMPAFAFSLVFYDRLETVVEIRLFTPLSQTAVLGTILAAAFTANGLWKSKLAPPVILAAAGLAGVVLLRL